MNFDETCLLLCAHRTLISNKESADTEDKDKGIQNTIKNTFKRTIADKPSCFDRWVLLLEISWQDGIKHIWPHYKQIRSLTQQSVDNWCHTPLIIRLGQLIWNRHETSGWFIDTTRKGKDLFYSSLYRGNSTTLLSNLMYFI